ncbi:MAG: 4,5-DOPA dioxygenase extradiol [Candidatus Eisenbacteria bacterium]
MTIQRMPALFVGHGNPMNAIEDNATTRAWRDLAATLPRPRAVVAVSAHWYVPGTRVTAGERPRTIHDFGGFPPALFAVEYPAPGDPALGRRIVERLAAGPAPVEARLDPTWGLDHGTWSVLCHLLPAADVPVIQVSLDETQPPSFHFALGRRLRPLRDEGVLVLGSGNLVHNLHAYAWGRHPVEPFDWAVRFESFARERILADDPVSLVEYETQGADAVLAVPTPEHYLPLLAALGARHAAEPATFPVEGIDGGSISMLSVRLG